MKEVVVPCNLPRRNSKFLPWLGNVVLKCLGWRITGELPTSCRKFILPVAPHTSNWDFIVAVAVMFSLDIQVTFLGKDAIFKGVFGRWLNRLGGIAIDRSHRHGVVGQMVDQFANNEQLILGLAPEGTRSKTTEWKTGFLYIAKQANVPLVPVGLDYGKKEVIFLPSYFVEGDIEQELQNVKAFYRSFCAKKPHLV